MNASKLIVSTAAALTVAGAIGLAYAQTSTTSPMGAAAPPVAESTTPPVQPAPVNSGATTPMPSNNATTMPGTSTPGGMANTTPSTGAIPTERVAQADRN